MSIRNRIRLISVGVILFALVLVGRLYFIQIVDGADFADRATEQYTRPSSGLYDRGTIYFQDKTGTLIPAADLATGYTIAINPTLIPTVPATGTPSTLSTSISTATPQGIYQALNAVVPLDQNSFLASVAKGAQGDTYEQIADQVPQTQADAIAALEISAVGIYDDRWRYYPLGDLASHVIGFVGYDGTTTDGRYGLEKEYDSTLERQDDNVYVNLFAQIFSNIQSVTGGAQEGDIVTSIDPNVEQYMEQQLQAVQAQYHSQVTGGIIINPQTGEIYAMGATPSFDPNHYGDVNNIGVFTNPLVQNVYEMGSVIKSLTMAAGLDAGVVTASSTYDDKGYLKIDGDTIWNYDHLGRGPDTTMQTVLGESLNTGAATVGLMLGNQRFANYMYKFGLASSTGIDLPNEAHDLVSNLANPRDIDVATDAFGQGIALTPIATVRALCALANGGNLITPHIVTQINYTNGTTKQLTYPVGPRVISPSAADQVSQMLTTVYQQFLVSDSVGAVKFTNYSVASKTGTAQIADPATGGYYPNEYLNSFFGYFPSAGSHAQYLVFLYTYEPQNVDFASQSLTPSFVNLVKYLINYYEIPPDR